LPPPIAVLLAGAPSAPETVQNRIQMVEEAWTAFKNELTSNAQKAFSLSFMAISAKKRLLLGLPGQAWSQFIQDGLEVGRVAIGGRKIDNLFSSIMLAFGSAKDKL